MVSIFEISAVFIFLGVFSIISYKKKFLDLDGILIADAVGVASITFGPHSVLNFIAFLAFFLIGQVASNFPKKKHERRSIRNVLGNSIPALAMLFMIPVLPEYALVFEMGFFGAISAALADTLSSEVGYYSKKKPRLITTMRPCKPGTDGGVTMLGEAAALFGGIVIGLIYLSIPLLDTSVNIHPAAALVVVGAGMVGTTADSWFGARYERKKVLNNTHVNLLGSSSGAIFALLLGFFLVL